ARVAVIDAKSFPPLHGRNQGFHGGFLTAAFGLQIPFHLPIIFQNSSDITFIEQVRAGLDLFSKLEPNFPNSFQTIQTRLNTGWTFGWNTLTVGGRLTG